jgi:hypothetical protein
MCGIARKNWVMSATVSKTLSIGAAMARVTTHGDTGTSSVVGEGKRQLSHRLEPDGGIALAWGHGLSPVA